MSNQRKPVNREKWTKDQTWEEIIEIVADRFGDENLNKSTVKRETSFGSGSDGINIDSLDTVELVMAFEDSFEISIPDETAPTLKTVGDTEKFISQQLLAAKRLI